MVEVRDPKNFEELVEVAKDEWSKIPMSVVRNCVDSMPRRLAQILVYNGNKADY